MRFGVPILLLLLLIIILLLLSARRDLAPCALRRSRIRDPASNFVTPVTCGYGPCYGSDSHFGQCLRPLPGRRRLLPAYAPLRTVRESFPSYGSSNPNLFAAVRAGGNGEVTFALLMVTLQTPTATGCVPEDASVASATVLCFLPVW